MWREGRSSGIWGHAVSLRVNVNGIWIWSESDSETTWIYSWTWIVSRSGSGCGSGSEMIGIGTGRTWRNESWSETKIFLCCESDSWTDCLRDRCCVSLVPFSSWLSFWP